MAVTPQIPSVSFVPPDEITSYFNWLIDLINESFLIIVAEGGGGSSNYLGAFTVAALPAAPVAGSTAYATNGRKISETTGNGTGVLVYFSAGSWRDMSTDANVQA